MDHAVHYQIIAFIDGIGSDVFFDLFLPGESSSSKRNNSKVSV
ncbi:MAG: hypothetical protein WCK15_16145 [Pirellula sp.]